MKKGLFIVIDGLDGSGKGEMVKLLHNYLFAKSKDYRILTTREPTNGTYGLQIRTILKEEKEPLKSGEKLLDLFTKDRSEHLENTIIPFLEKSNHTCNIVICDRYYYSTIVFQHTQGIPFEKVIEKNIDFKKPDIALILDVPVDIALQRIKNREKQIEKFEQPEFMEKLRKNFLELKNHLNDNIVIIDASKSKEEVFEEIKIWIENILRRH